MKKIAILSLSLALLLAGCSSNEISNGDITLRLNAYRYNSIGSGKLQAS